MMIEKLSPKLARIWIKGTSPPWLGASPVSDVRYLPVMDQGSGSLPGQQPTSSVNNTTIELNGKISGGFMSRCLTSDGVAGDRGAYINVNQTVNFTFSAGQGLMDKNATYLFDGQPWNGTVWAKITIIHSSDNSEDLPYYPESIDSTLQFDSTGVAVLPYWNVFTDPNHVVNFTITFHQPGVYIVTDDLEWYGTGPIHYLNQGICHAFGVDVHEPVMVGNSTTSDQTTPSPSADNNASPQDNQQPGLNPSIDIGTESPPAPLQSPSQEMPANRS
jgi:hypothetical protein